MPLVGGGDILTYEDYNACMKTNVSGTMIARYSDAMIVEEDGVSLVLQRRTH